MENDRILERFSPKFKEKILLNPMYRAVHEVLLQGTDEYKIIEDLLEQHENLCNAIVKLQEEQKPKQTRPICAILSTSITPGVIGLSGK